MRTLVTGATGYLGAELVGELTRRGREVRALARSPASAARLEGTGAEIVQGDVLDEASLDRALEGVARVFHMAGAVGHRASDEPRLRAVNVDGARAVLAACTRAGVERVVFTSSVATIGPAGGPGHPRDEGAWLLDGDDGRGDFRYGRTKAAGEQAALAAAAGGLDVVITNPGFVIGPGDVHRVSSWPVEEYLRGRLRFTVDGGLSYVDVRDVVAGHLLAEERGRSGERYILGGADVTLTEAFALISRAAGRRPPRLELPYGAAVLLARLGVANRDEVRLARLPAWFSSAKAERELGYSASPVDPALELAVVELAPPRAAAVSRS